jgi:hypothetical protein
MRIGLLDPDNMGRHMARHLLGGEMTRVRLYEALAGQEFRLSEPSLEVAS